MKRMKRICEIVCFLGLICLLTGCAKEEIAEGNIVAILPDEIWDIEYNNVVYPGTFVALELVERNTDKFRGKDDIKAVISVKKKYIDISLSYTDEEWVLKSCDDYDNEKMTVMMEPPVSEDTLYENLPEDVAVVTVDGELLSMEITSFEVEKRQTDVSSKADTAWCVVTMENEYYEYTKYITLTYSYYDVKGGWLLDSCWEDNSKMEYEVKKNPINEREVLAVPTGVIYSLTLLECNEDFENNTIVYTMEAVSEAEYSITKWVETKTYYFDGYYWNESSESGESNVEWDILGEYYVEGMNDNLWFYLNITDFDPINKTIKGSCSFTYNYPAAFSYNSDYYDLNDKEVEVTDRTIKILIDNVGGYSQTDIYFERTRAIASYDRYWTEKIYRY